MWVELYDSETTGEQILFNQSDPSQQWVVLPNDWRESQLTNYFAVEDIDLATLDVFIDEASQRRYIIDENAGDRYFLVTATGMSTEFKKRWLYLSQLNQTDLNNNDTNTDRNNDLTVITDMSK